MSEQRQSLLGDRPNLPSAALQAEQARLLYAGIPVSLAVNILIASILAAVQLSVLDVKPIMFWCTLFGATIVLRAMISVTYRHAPVDESASKAQLTRFRICTATTGIAWGLASFLLFPIHDIPHQSFLAFAIAGMTAGAVTSLSVDLVSSLVFIIPALVPLIVRLLAVGGEIPLAMGVMGTIYLVALILNSRRTYHNNRENICLRLDAVAREQSASVVGNLKEEFPLLRRFSITLLVSMLVTASLLVFLYRQDQLTVFESNASEENERVLDHLVYALGGDIASYISTAKDNSSTPPNIQDLDFKFAQELKRINEGDILKLKIYNTSGIAIYSSASTEIGKPSKRGELLARALNGETAHATESRDMFLGTAGEMHDAHLFITYMPIMHSGKQIGVIESYEDSALLFEKLNSKTLWISLLVCGVFSALYTALFFAVRSTDQSLAGWKKAVERSEEFLNKAQSITHVGSWDYDLATGKLEWSKELYRIYGVSPETYTPSIGNLIKLIHPDDQSAMQKRTKAWTSGEQSPTIVFRCVWPDGSIRQVEGHGELIFDANGKPVYVSGTVQDITERKQAEAALQLLEEKFSRVFHDSPDAMLITEINTGLIREINQSFTELFGYSQEEAVGHTTLDLGIWLDEDSRKETVAIIKAQGFLRNQEFKHRTKDGLVLTLLITTNQLHSSGTTSLVIHFRDITQRKEVEEKLQFTQYVSDHAPDSILWVDEQARICYVNEAVCREHGYTKEELLAMTIPDFDPEFPAEAWPAHWQELKQKGSLTFETRHTRKDGSVYPVEVCANFVKFDGKEFNVAYNRDITERKRVEDEIRQLAFHDTLTGLPNRRLLEDRLDQAMAASKRSGQYGAVVFLDLDNFKPLNDKHGHKAGDLLLIEVAQRLARCVREVDTVARFGGDEFVVVLSELVGEESDCTAQANIVAQKIQSALAEPYWLDYNAKGTSKMILHNTVGASIGVALFNNVSNAENILKWADKAMYQAKDAGRNQVRFYEATT